MSAIEIAEAGNMQAEPSNIKLKHQAIIQSYSQEFVGSARPLLSFLKMETFSTLDDRSRKLWTTIRTAYRACYQVVIQRLRIRIPRNREACPQETCDFAGQILWIQITITHSPSPIW